MDLQSIILEVPLIHLSQIIDSVIEDDWKFFQLRDESIIFRVLYKTHTIIIKVIRLDWTQHLNGILVVSIDTSIVIK